MPTTSFSVSRGNTAVAADCDRRGTLYGSTGVLPRQDEVRALIETAYERFRHEGGGATAAPDKGAFATFSPPLEPAAAVEADARYSK